jgi:hypothetical protein
VATQSVWSRFRRWRRTRPFWGGLFLLLSALALFLSANLTLADMQVHFGQEGYLSYVLPVVLVLCGLLAWFSPGQRLFYGVLGLLTALYSFLGLNLGGFGLGMLLGIVGGALTIAWGPARKPPAPPAPAAADTAAGTAVDTAADEPDEPDEPDGPADDEQSPESERIDVAGSDLPPRSPYYSDPATEIMPGFDDEPEQPRQSPNGGTHRKLLVITLVPLAVAAAVLAGGGRSPARAADCPDGMPSRSATGISAAKKQTTATKKPATAKPRSSSPKAKPGAKTTPEDDKADPEPSASPSTDDRNPIVGGLRDLIGSIGKAVGIGADETPSPSPPASPSASPSPAPATSPPPSAPSSPTPTAHPAAPGGTGPPGTSAAPTPVPSSSDIPCLGARVLGKEAGSDGIPQVALKPGLLEGDSLQMYGSTYDGVSDMTTADGSYRALKFSMDKSVTKPFTLTIPEPGGGTTVIKTAALTTDGHVQFFTPHFEGKLFGLIPVVFTPDSPPPLTLPYLWFTDVKIDLAFVSCDTLTGHPVLTINEEQPANG